MTDDLDALRAEFDEFAQPKKTHAHTAREERIIAGFEEIQRFVNEHGHAPRHGEERDIFERLYAVRLDRLRALEECRELLVERDHQGLLAIPVDDNQAVDDLDDDELLAALTGGSQSDESITTLRHVRSRSEVRMPEEIASREPCKDFDAFQPLFERAERELKNGERLTRAFGDDPSIQEGDFFILSGQMVYIAQIGEWIKAPNEQRNARMRVIYSNGTESNLLLRSLERALYKDETGRRLTHPGTGPLFGDSMDEEDLESGTLYILRSRADHPFVAENRELIHKIGVTGGKVETRIANAASDATYLLADVITVGTFKLAGVNRVKLENLLHRVFAPAQINITIEDRFGKPVRPREWFLVPYFVVEEAVERVRDGSIVNYVYDPEKARLVRQER